MADNEIKKVITVDLGDTKTTLKDYKKHIDELRASLLNLDKTSEEYKNISKQIAEEQNKLNEVMSIGKKDTDAADGSYNKLVQTMNELKKQWKATADETERAELGKKILDINNQLKELDASTGIFQRKVGDYENSFKSAMGSLKDGLTGTVPSFGKVNTAMKLISTNPMIAIIGALVTTFGLLAKAIKGSEEQTNKISQAFSVFQPILNGIKNTITAIADGVVWLEQKISEVSVSIMKKIKTVFSSLGFDEWAQNIQTALDKMEETANIKQREIDLQKQSRDNLRKEADLNLEISELRAKMYDKETYNAKQRLEFLNQWETKEKELANLRKSKAQEEYDLIVKKNSLTATSSKDLDAEAQAYANLQRATQEYNESLRTIRKTRNTILNEMKGSGNIANATKENIEEAVENIEEETEDVIDRQTQSILDRLHKRYTDELELLREKYEEEKALLEQYGLDTIQLQQEFEEEAEKIIDKNLEAERNAKIEKEKEDEKRKEDAKKEAEEELKIRRQLQNSIISSTASMFGALSDLAEEGSEEQKAFAIMETIINTLQSIMGTWAGYSEMGPWGIAAATVQTAALAATGAATIAKMKSTTKDSSFASVSAPQVQTPSMTSVTPLLDETSDINRMDMSGLQGNSIQEQTIKCYVVESEINEVQNKVKVTEQNATF